MVTDEPGGRRDANDPAGAEIVDLGTTVTPAVLGTGGRDRWIGPAGVGFAVVIVVAGIVLASRPDLAIVAASPTVQPSESGQVSIATPRPTASPRPTRSIAPPPPCLPADGGTDTSLVVRNGLLTWQLPTIDLGNAEPLPPDDWAQRIRDVRTYDATLAVRAAAGDEIRVGSFGLTCISWATATFVRLDEAATPTPVTAGGRIEPAASAGSFIAPAPGDWLVRFLVALPMPGDTRWEELYGRLLVGDGAVPPRPSVLPNARCGPADGTLDAALSVDEALVPGTAPGQGAPAPELIPFGAMAEIRLAGDRCATTWVIRGTRRITAQHREPLTFEAAYRSAIPDLAIAAQNRFPIVSEPIGTWDITATFAFPDGSELARTWAVAYEEVAVPPLRVARQGSSISAGAWIGCGAWIEAPNGRSYGVDSCASSLPDRPLEQLVVSPGSRLTFDVAGWEVANWSAESGTVSGEPLGFQPVEDGFLRGATSPPVDFPAPRAGSWALQVYATLVRADGLRISGSWYVLVDVR